jgi:hypothetical protein
MNDSKQWYLSKTIWGAVVAFLSMVAGAIFGVEVDADTQAVLVDQVVAGVSAVITLIGLVMVVIGRLSAKKAIAGPGATPGNSGALALLIGAGLSILLLGATPALALAASPLALSGPQAGGVLLLFVILLLCISAVLHHGWRARGGGRSGR